MEGTVKWFARKKGFGFIESQGKKYFVHISNIEANSELDKGDKVFFEPKESPRGTRAVKVKKIEE